ncbi:hypothetical protein DB30_07804 [Enhygromyxa salina]|uniref:Uncharacterized protein n=1 Tax=Enhygromyxa salina TaxID=215803 RepID=A0A0C1ZMX1_9BACT|nr:hypothetical protein DB30_07804 [Enhygromyxa salina]
MSMLALVACADKTVVGGLDAGMESSGDGDGDGESTGDGDGDGDGESAGDGDVPVEHPNTGAYLLAVETNLGPDLPLVFIATITLELADDGVTWLADFHLQPLSMNQGESDPGEPVGPALEYLDVVIVDDGFKLDMGEVDVMAAANPITGSDLTMIGALLGQFVGSDALCGDLEGMLVSPLEADLAGSNFAAIKVADISPEALPVSFPYRCDMLP